MVSSFSRINKTWSLPVLAVVLLFALAPQSQAALLGTTPTLPGQSLFPGLVPPGTPAGTLIAGPLVSPYSFTTTSGTTSGSLTTSVYRETGGTLDFYYQVANSGTSATAIARETDTSFTGYTTGLGYRTDGATLTGYVNGTVAPTTGDVNTVGSVVGFQFNPPDSAKILPGLTSNVLVISTNATNYTAGNASIIDGGTQTVAAYQPAAGVPEPGTMVLLGAGLLALAGVRKFRK